MNETILRLAVASLLLTLVGCDSLDSGSKTGKNIASALTQETAKASGEQESVPEVPVEDAAAAKSYRQNFSDWMGAAAKSGQSASSAAGQWVTNSWNAIADTGSTSATSAATWANQTYESMRDAGLTQAGSARDWLLEEYNRPNAWEYKTEFVNLKVGFDGNLQELTARLNELGADRWECFAVKELTSDGSCVMFFKRHPKSYLPNLPLTDTLKLLNLMRTEKE